MSRLIGRSFMIPIVLLLCLVLCSCVGPFNLTSNVLDWNNSINGGRSWLGEIVFLVFVWVPVYGICMIGDALIFNTIEFWGGTNPIAATSDGSAPAPASALAVARNDRGGADVRDSAGRVVLSSEALPDGSVVFRNASGAEVSHFTPVQAQAMRERLSLR